MPEDFHAERYNSVVDFPDALSVDERGRIIGWLGTGDRVTLVVLAD